MLGTQRNSDTRFRKVRSSKRWSIVWAASLLFGIFVSCQEGRGQGYELVCYHARLQLFPRDQALSCLDTLYFKSTVKRDSGMALGLGPVFNVEFVELNGVKSKFQRTRDAILFDGIPSVPEFRIVVRYSGVLPSNSEFARLDVGGGVLSGEEVFPRCSMELQSVRLMITVPKGWRAIAAGHLAAADSFRDSTSYLWVCDQSLASNGWICAGAFQTWRNEQTGIAVDRADGDSASAEKILGLASDALKFYGRAFSAYRFSKLEIVEVGDWVAGRNVLAIAAPSFIMVKRTAFTTPDRFNQVQSILPHEIAHQWWPMTVFLNEEDNAFLSEGMCDYSAYLFDEARGAMTQRDSLKHHPLLRPLLMRAAEGKDVPLHGKNDLRSFPTQYLKASYVHNMLRRMLGDSLFLRLYREYAARFALKRASLDEFQCLAEELSGKKLQWFFDQWVRRPGVPRLKVYNVKSIATNGYWLVRGRVRVVGYEQYTTFTDVGILTASGIVKTRVWVGIDSTGAYRNDVQFELKLDSQPLRAIVDPDGDILKFQEMPVKFSDLREPADGLMVVGSHGKTGYLLGLARQDSALMVNAGWSIKIAYDSGVTLGDLQNERVLLYGRASDNRVVAKLQEKFPIRFQGDSVLVNGEAMFDSAMTMMEAIENPYLPRGLIGWICPFTEKATPELFPFDASWVLLRGKDQLASGVWESVDKDLEVQIR